MELYKLPELLIVAICVINQAEFVLGPAQSKSSKTFIRQNIYIFTIEHM